MSKLLKLREQYIEEKIRPIVTRTGKELIDQAHAEGKKVIIATLCSGSYNIYIEDLYFGCIDTVPGRGYAQYEMEVISTILMVSCYGNNSGSVTIDSIIGGNEPYDVQWGGFDNLFLPSGTYDVNVVDSIGCVHEESFTINQSNQIIVDAVIQPSSCHGQSDGIITIDVYGGVGPLSYFWLNGTGTADSLYSLPQILNYQIWVKLSYYHSMIVQ